MSISPNLTVMARAIEKASRSVVRDFGEVEKLQISMKGPGDFVSKADKRCEEILVESLTRDRPEWGVLGEEGADIKGSDARYRWIIDPIDGTTNFLHGLPHWCITVALEKDNEIIAGMTFDPIRQEMFRAEKGGGAFMNTTRLRVSGRKELNVALVGMDGPVRHCMAAATDVWTKSKEASGGIRDFACAALTLAYVAAGRIDVSYITGAKPWDIAAGVLMVKEAAGLITGLDNKSADIYKGEILAANPTLHKKFMALIGTQA